MSAGVAGRRRVLVVADAYPWPIRDGYRQRLGNLVRLMTERAEVDLVAVIQPGEEVEERAPASVSSAITITCPPKDPLRRVLALTTSQWPSRVSGRDWAPAHASLAGFADSRYDVVWCSHADVYLALQPDLHSLGPVVVDLDNLEDWTLRRLRSGAGGPDASTSLAPGSFLRVQLDQLDSRRWAKAQSQIRDRVAGVVVCSETDRRRLGGARTKVVANGYDWDGPLASLPRPPVVLLVGMFRYLPNLQGAQYMVREVWPLVRRLVPDAVLRIVGRHDERLVDLGTPAGVEIVGEVEDISSELDRARVSVAPVLSGSGTRVKILEAWAHGLPVASTSVGCEGLDARAGHHLLVGDGPEQLARACEQLLVDDGVWQAVAGAGHELWAERYQWATMGPSLEEILDLAQESDGREKWTKGTKKGQFG